MRTHAGLVYLGLIVWGYAVGLVIVAVIFS